MASVARQDDTSAGGGGRSRPTAQTLQRPVHWSLITILRQEQIQDVAADVSLNVDGIFPLVLLQFRVLGLGEVLIST